MQPKTNTVQSGQDMLSNVSEKLPGILSALNAQAVPAAQAQLAADQAYNPGYMELMTNLYKMYGPQLNEIGSQVDRQNAFAGAQTDADLMAGVGGQNVMAADSLQRQLDPEFYSNRALIGSKQSDLLNSVDPTRLTGGELENVSRGLGRTGQTFLPGGMSGAASAMQFGNALAGKQDRFASYLNSAQQGLNSMKSGLNGFGIGTNKPMTSNTGQNLFGMTQGSGNQAYQTGNNFMSGTFENQKKQYEGALDRTGKVMSMGGNVIGGIMSGI